MKRTISLFVLLMVATVVLVGCGGGGGDNAQNSNTTTANAGPDRSIVVGSVAQLDGSQSTGAGGSLITYQWSMVSYPAGSAAIIINPTTVNPTCTPDLPGQYFIKLIVTDAKSITSEDTVTITASVANAAPVANAGIAQSVTTGTVVTLNGSGSSDANGDPLTYSWAFTSRPAGSSAALSSATVVNPTFTADVAGSYVLNLVVNDGKVNSAPATVTITASVANEIISGIINTNLTLSISKSPYYFNNVQLDYGATLTIEPGVVINGGSIQVWGNLNAIGSISSKIFFNGVLIKPGTSNSGRPYSINIQYAEIKGGQIYYPTGNAIYGNFALRDSIINNIGWVYIWYPTSNCYIERNIISGAQIEILTNGSVMLYIRNNVFYNTSITSLASYSPSGAIVKYNSFLNGLTLRLEPNYGNAIMSATENFWNTTDTSVIDSMIYDRNDNLSYAGYITYLPILTSPHPDTPIPIP
jgi:hypothetical protein